MAGRQHTTRSLFKRLLQGISTPLLKQLVAGVLLAFSLTPAVAQEAGSVAVIERLNATLLEVMKAAEALGYQGRYERLAPVLKESYDFPFMTRIACATAWRDMTPEEQDLLVGLFTEMSIASYAARFDGYGGETFEIVGEAPGPRDAVVVETRLVRPDDEPVGLNYVMREGDGDHGGWRIVDVLLDAKFSELARQKSEFSAVLRKGGVADLTALLEDKIANLEAEGRA